MCWGVEVVPTVLQNRCSLQRWGGLHKAPGQQRRRSYMADVSDHIRLCSVTANLKARGANLIYRISSLRTNLGASWQIYRKKAEATLLQNINAKKCHSLVPGASLSYSLPISCCTSPWLWLVSPIELVEIPHFRANSSLSGGLFYYFSKVYYKSHACRPRSTVNVNATTSANVSYEKFTDVR